MKDKRAKLGLAGGLLGTLALLVFMASPPVEQHAEAAAPTYYSYLCRGPFRLAMSTYGRVEVRGHKSTTKASGGLGLAPGTCAWSDRPLNPNEPVTLSFPFGHESDSVVMPMLSACAHDSECIVFVQARADGDRIVADPNGWVVTSPRDW